MVKKIMILTLVIVCMTITLVASVEPVEAEQTPSPDKLFAYESYQGEYHWYYYTLKDYECDMDLITMLSIARLETGNFTSDAYVNGHNWGGISINEKPLVYESEEDGVIAFVNLMQSYYDKGLRTPEEIGKKYCPINSEWSNLVKKIMNEEQNNIQVRWE